MNFLGIPTVSVGFITPPDDTYDILTYTDGDNYKMAVIKDDVLIGLLHKETSHMLAHILNLSKKKLKLIIWQIEYLNLDIQTSSK